jgi:hypothetical protein
MGFLGRRADCALDASVAGLQIRDRHFDDPVRRHRLLLLDQRPFAVHAPRRDAGEIRAAPAQPAIEGVVVAHADALAAEGGLRPEEAVDPALTLVERDPAALAALERALAGAGDREHVSRVQARRLRAADTAEARVAVLTDIARELRCVARRLVPALPGRRRAAGSGAGSRVARQRRASPAIRSRSRARPSSMKRLASA